MTRNTILEAIRKKVRTKTKIKKQQLPSDVRSSFERKHYIWTDLMFFITTYKDM